MRLLTTPPAAPTRPTVRMIELLFAGQRALGFENTCLNGLKRRGSSLPPKLKFSLAAVRPEPARAASRGKPRILCLLPAELLWYCAQSPDQRCSSQAVTTTTSADGSRARNSRIRRAAPGRRPAASPQRMGITRRRCCPTARCSSQPVTGLIRARTSTMLASDLAATGSQRPAPIDSHPATASGSPALFSKASRKPPAATLRIHRAITQSCSCAASTTARLSLSRSIRPLAGQTQASLLCP
jgi:hypothetical protein